MIKFSHILPRNDGECVEVLGEREVPDGTYRITNVLLDGEPVTLTEDERRAVLSAFDDYECRAEVEAEVYGKTNDHAGRPILMSRKFTATYQGLFVGALAQILCRKDRGAAFVGCEVVVRAASQEFKLLLEERFTEKFLLDDAQKVVAKVHN